MGLRLSTWVEFSHDTLRLGPGHLDMWLQCQSSVHADPKIFGLVGPQYIVVIDRDGFWFHKTPLLEKDCLALFCVGLILPVNAPYINEVDVFLHSSGDGSWLSVPVGVCAIVDVEGYVRPWS